MRLRLLLPLAYLHMLALCHPPRPLAQPSLPLRPPPPSPPPPQRPPPIGPLPRPLPALSAPASNFRDVRAYNALPATSAPPPSDGFTLQNKGKQRAGTPANTSSTFAAANAYESDDDYEFKTG